VASDESRYNLSASLVGGWFSLTGGMFSAYSERLPKGVVAMKRILCCVVLAAGLLLAAGCCCPGGGGCDWMGCGTMGPQPVTPAPVYCQ